MKTEYKIVVLIMRLIVISSFFIVGCTTTDVNPVTKPEKAEPAKLKVGMSESEVLSILGEPKQKTSVTLGNGEVVETWVYRHLVREWRTIQHTDFETIQKPNLITGEFEEVVVPVESTVTRTLHQEIIVKIKNGRVIGIDSDMIEDVEEAY